MIRFFFTIFCCLLPVLVTSTGAAQDRQPASSLVVVGGDRSYPPYEFLNEEGEPSGFNVELTEAVARVMGFEVVFRFGSWGEIRQGLASGAIDILQGMAFSRQRTSEVDFSVPHAVIHQSIWNRRDGQHISSVAEMAGKEVIVMQGSIMHDYMQREQPAAQLLTVSSLADALRMLAAGRGDCALVAKLPGQYLVKKFALDNVEPVARPLLAQDYGYAVHKGNRALLARFNDGLAILRQTGEYQRIYRKWLGVLEPQPLNWRKLSGYLLMVAVPLLLVISAISLWSRTLKKEVAARTSALEQEAAGHRKTMEELKVRQRQLIQADKMTSLGILVSGVAHEVNNPTGLLLFNLPHLAKAFEAARPILDRHYEQQGDFKLGWLQYSRMREEIPAMLEEMQQGAQRIKRIVDDLKDFSRQQDGDLLQPVDINAIVATALRLVDNQLRKATRHFSVSYGENLPALRGNQQRIEQVLVNLILNACQALPSLEAAIRLTTGYDAASRRLLLTLEDEGSGIPAEHLPLLTDPFFTTKRDQGGTGLGLSISAGIVREHGGTLDFHSEPGQGTTVVLAFPAITEEPS